MGKHTTDELRQMQALPLDVKVRMTETRIIDWYQHWGGRVYVSFSGGKDSTVLLDIVRRLFPDVPAVFVNTGLEYPEISNFALSHENVTELRPRWGKKLAEKYGRRAGSVFSFKDVLKIYGYPLISKAVSNCVVEARRTPYRGSRWKRLHGDVKRDDGSKSSFDHSRYLPLYSLPIKISDECCKAMKKSALFAYEREHKSVPIVATMTFESTLRLISWLNSGCNTFESSRPISKPMSFWTEHDVLQYHVERGLPMCSVYGDVVYTDADGAEYDAKNPLVADVLRAIPLKCTGCQRTGCIFCAFGAHLKKGRNFRDLRVTHSKLYDYCINGGEWVKYEKHDPTVTDPNLWNPKFIWQPSNKGLGMGTVFDMLNEIYGKDFIPYK